MKKYPFNYGDALTRKSVSLGRGEPPGIDKSVVALSIRYYEIPASITITKTTVFASIAAMTTNTKMRAITKITTITTTTTITAITAITTYITNTTNTTITTIKIIAAITMIAT